VTARLVDRPGDFLVKADLAMRIALGAGPLRTLVAQYLSDSVLRRQVPYHALMNDLLKLDVVRRVRAGVLRTRQPFQLYVDFDAGTGQVTLTSVPLRKPGNPVTGRARRRDVDRAAGPTQLEDALKRGRVKLIVWDHSASSLEIVYAAGGRKWITLGIGPGGIHRFEMLARLAKHDPARMASVLIPILAGEAVRR
jgi:hypothetical protein